MKPSKPPAVASWMLRHLVLGNQTEALEGDLLEEFQRRRSAGWYWRQVAGAILGFSNLLRMGWVMVWTAGFAAAWVYGLCLFVALATHSPLQFVSGNGRSIPVSAMGVPSYLGLPLCLYLALTHRLSLRAFAVGLGVGMCVLMLLSFLHAELAWPMNYVFAHAVPRLPHAYLWRRLYGVLQGVPPLVAAIWAAALCKEKAGSPAKSQQAHTPSTRAG